MTLWAAHGRARQAPHRGALAAALDSESRGLIHLTYYLLPTYRCRSPVGYVDYIQLDAEDVES